MNLPRVVTVVSGVPRSGTSLLMRMLWAGGMPILTDGTRPADASNPTGYFEHDAVRTTARDDSWVDDAAGKAVKVIHLLLPRLPPRFHYRVLFARRDMGEVLASQQALLHDNGRRGADLAPGRLAEALAAQATRALEWADRQPHVALLPVHFHDVINHPPEQARRMNQFLGGALDEAAMAAAVDPSLYRHRRADYPLPERHPCTPCVAHDCH